MSALISVLLLASISTPAHANGAPSTVNCSVSGTFTITSGVVSAGNSCAGSAVVPADVTSIGEDAFAGAAALTSIAFDGTSSLTSIGATAFQSASSLTSITIPASVTSIGISAFDETPALTSVAFDGTSSLTSIGNAAFFNARALTSITIPASVTSIGDYAFQDAISLVSVYFLGNAPATIGTTPFLNTAAGAKALIRSGATGFTTSGTPALWNGLAVEVVADTPAPAPAPVPTPKLATTGPSEQIALGAIASSSIFMLLTGAMLLIRRRELS
jgi:hypothetical protein